MIKDSFPTSSFAKDNPSRETHSDLLYQARSEEAQEIIGKMPPWIIRYGVLIIGLIVLFVIILSSYIRFPDSIPINVHIPYTTIVLRASPKGGIIKNIFVSNNQPIDAGLPLLEMDNPQGLGLVLKLEQYTKNIITTLNSSEPRFSKKDFKNGELGVFADSYYLMNTALDAYYLHAESKTFRFHAVQNAQKLLMEILDWKKQFLIVSPISGLVKFNRQLVKNSYVSPNESVLTIVKDITPNMVVKAQVNANSADNISKGQVAILHVPKVQNDNIGYIEGVVTACSKIVINGELTMYVKLPNGLVTNKGYKVLANNQTYQAEIILDNQSIAGKCFSSLNGFHKVR